MILKKMILKPYGRKPQMEAIATGQRGEGSRFSAIQPERNRVRVSTAVGPDAPLAGYRR